MAISIDWATKVISIPQSYLTLIAGTLYELDTEQFRLDLKDLEDDVWGMTFPDTHRHNTEFTVAGTTYARGIEIINGYSITFENGYYSVRLVGSNNNIFDIQNGILNQNFVQVIPGNSAGLIVKSIGSGLSTEEHDAVMEIPGIGDNVDFLIDILKNKRYLNKEGSTWYLIVRNATDTDNILKKALKDKSGDDISDLEAGMLAQELKTSV